MNLPLACEAARAGAWGFVDLEDVADEGGFRRDLEQLRLNADVPVGVKLDASRQRIWQPLLPDRPSFLNRVLLSRPSRSEDELRGVIAALQGSGLQVLVETVSVEEALAAQGAGADGIVAKGSEAGGRIGDETCFILLQRLAGVLQAPFYAHGGVGLHTAAACQVAGASGAVLDWQVCLVEESRLSAEARRALAPLDGSETIAVGRRVGDAYRLHVGPTSRVLRELEQREHQLVTANVSPEERIAGWRAAVDEVIAASGGAVRKLGTEISFSERLARRFRTIGRLLEAMDRSLRFHLSRARQAPPLRPEAGVCGTLGTRYPIVQGPMSRVSDTASFAAAVAEAGGLPVMAVAAMAEDELEAMLRETREQLGGRPWAAGLLGFLPAEQYGAQIELVKKYRPSTVVIAGGRPAQARQIEQEGIRTFIHVPSPRLLDLYLDDGVRNIIFEGLECGGHIGRASAFVLWENCIEVLLARFPRGATGDRCAVLFAGGISTALSAAMVSSIIAPLADRGVNVGVLVGTGYLFTREAVECGAINSGFQGTVLAARQTTILDCGGGYKIRAAPTPFCDAFEEEKQRLIEQGLPAEEVRMSLEHLTLGRLRIAAKGLRFNVKRLEDDTQAVTLPVPEPEQKRDGVYMAGQAILLHDSACSVEDLHRRISEGSMALLREEEGALVAAPRSSPLEIAIVGMSGLFPGARGLDEYWDNILSARYSITEVPDEQWSLESYFDPEQKSRDKIYSRWGGFLEPIAFDPLKYGIPPNSLRAIDPMQILTMELVGRALRDAGYDQREFDRENTSVFVGEGGGLGNLGQLYSFRSLLPTFMEKVPEELLRQLPDWTEDSFPGLLPNVIAGRVANQFDLGGTNLSTSAACAAGLAALSLGMDELRSGDSAMSIVAAVDVQQNPFTYLCFSKTMALSPTGTPRCFDASGDGIVISQGVGVLILKRLEDAERDGDRIYAVLRGMGSSSDGRGKSLTAPMSKGQRRAMRRAYEQAGFGLDTVELIEAHGTGTVLGDRTEAETITHALREAGAPPRSCAVGTVKSMIGHTKGCAGIAGLIKVALALHHEVLPPTLWVKEPAVPELWEGDSPAYLNTALRPWVGREHPRRAAVSSFGFGGTNFHAVLEEYRPKRIAPLSFPTPELPAELFCFRAPGADRLRADLEELLQEAADSTSLRELARRTWESHRGQEPSGSELSLSIVAESVDDLRAKLGRALPAITSGSGALLDPRGVYFDPGALGRSGKLALLFPGQGSQRVDMLKDISLLFHEMRAGLNLADRVLASRFELPLSHYVYPPASFSEEEKRASVEALTRTDITQPALGAVEAGLYRVARAFGVRPDMAAGHSVGEYVALATAGVFDEETLAQLLWTRGACILRAAGTDTGTMLAVRAARETLEEALRDEPEIYVANLNAPRQTVVSGRRDSLVALQEKLADLQVESRLLPVGCGFHSPFVEKAAAEFGEALAAVRCSPAAWPVYSNYLAAAHANGEKDVREALSAHLSHPVRFVEEIQKMYDDGARVFLELGPGKVCTSLVGEILDGRPHRAISCDGAPARSGAVRFLHALGQLFAQCVDLRLDPLFNRRAPSVEIERRDPATPKVTWMVSPETSWPAGSSRPRVVPLAETAAAPPSTSPASISDGSRGSGVPASSPARPAAPSAAPAPAPDPAPAPAPWPAPSAARASAPADRSPTGPSASPLTEVMLRHQQLMATFVEQQTQVMQTFLQGRRQPAGDSAIAGLGQRASAPSPRSHAVANPQAASPPAPPTAAAPPPSPMPVPSASVSPAAAAEDAAIPTSAELLTRLAGFVAERTGYPVEMLTAEREMEMELGIDSIKRIEILTSFAREFPGLRPEAVEELREARTLQDVAEAMHENMNGGSGGRGSPEPPPPAAADAGGAIDRYVIGMRESALADRSAVPIPEGVIVITDEGRGVAAGLAERLRSLGARPTIVRLEGPDVPADGVYAADIADPVQAEGLLDRIREAHGRIGGIVHLLPLRDVPPVPELSADAHDRHVSQEVKGLFHLVRAAAKELTSTPGGWVWTCLSFGALPENGTLPVPEHPWRGGLVGIVKTVAVEWPEVVAKSLVLEGSHVDEMVERILAETAGPRDEHEVYYRGGTRLVPEPQKVPLGGEGEPLALGPEDVVMLIGGARGITAEVACEMARQARPTLLLVGRSPWPEAESAVTAGATGAAEVRRALFAHLKEQGQQPSPIEVDQAARRILREREMREARAQMEAAGSRVVYYQADLRDAAATQQLLDRIYEAHGRLDGVIYGAGVIEDKLIPDKTPESFDRVFDTKARAIFHLARAMRPEGLKFFVMFSSVAGWTGNRGQVDYVAANEVLNRTALHLSARWGRRVVAVDWGPWDKAGMVTAETRRQFLARGVALVTPEAGRRFMLDEIRHGGSAPAIVAAMGRLDEEEAAIAPGVAAPEPATIRR